MSMFLGQCSLDNPPRFFKQPQGHISWTTHYVSWTTIVGTAHVFWDSPPCFLGLLSMFHGTVHHVSRDCLTMCSAYQFGWDSRACQIFKVIVETNVYTTCLVCKQISLVCNVLYISIYQEFSYLQADREQLYCKQNWFYIINLELFSF